MGSSVAENIPTPCGIIHRPFRGPQFRGERKTHVTLPTTKTWILGAMHPIIRMCPKLEVLKVSQWWWAPQNVFPPPVFCVAFGGVDVPVY